LPESEPHPGPVASKAAMMPGVCKRSDHIRRNFEIIFSGVSRLLLREATQAGYDGGQEKDGRMTKEVPRRAVRLLAAGLTLSLPDDSPYDRQLMVEHLSALLTRHGAVRLSSGRRAWWLTLTPPSINGDCVRCRRPLDRAVQLPGGAVACVPCASRSIVSDSEKIQRPAA
jgi:hypothetical protein